MLRRSAGAASSQQKILPSSREGRVFKTRSIRTAFENAAETAGLDEFHFHDTRHHFASWFMMREGSLQELKEILATPTSRPRTFVAP